MNFDEGEIFDQLVIEFGLEHLFFLLNEKCSPMRVSQRVSVEVTETRAQARALIRRVGGVSSHYLMLQRAIRLLGKREYPSLEIVIEVLRSKPATFVRVKLAGGSRLRVDLVFAATLGSSTLGFGRVPMDGDILVLEEVGSRHSLV